MILELTFIEQILAGACALLLIWIIILTWQLFAISGHYKNLVKGSDKKDLKLILDKILNSLNVQENDLVKIYKKLDELEHLTSFHLQELSFTRFNPFEETGGNQSFILALLDKHKNGMVLTSLHSREVTRLYAKKLVKGSPVDSELSDEEKEAVAKAKRFES